MLENNTGLLCNSSIMSLLCSYVVTASCLLSSDKKNERPPDVTHDMISKIDWVGVTH